MTQFAVFDINETTLDLTPVRERVDRLLGPEGGFTVWFQRLLQIAMTLTATGEYEDFSTLAPSAYRAVVATGKRADAQTEWQQGWDEVAEAMAGIEPYPDVRDGLERLRDGGVSTIALTNSAPASVGAQLERTGLAPLFDHILTVDPVRQYKPGAAPYRQALDVAGGDAASTWMVACHDWDLAGARAVGMRTAFVERPAMSHADVFATPDVSVTDFGALADVLLANASLAD